MQTAFHSSAVEPRHLKLVASTGAEDRSGKGRSRIVVAEDDVEMRRVIAEALREEGYEVLEAADGMELLAQLEYRVSGHGNPTVDLIVTDVRMPGCSGLDISELLRRAGWQTPIIVMTAFGDRDTRARAHGLGARMVEKPFRLDVLLMTIRASLG